MAVQMRACARCDRVMSGHLPAVVLTLLEEELLEPMDAVDALPVFVYISSVCKKKKKKLRFLNNR